MRNGRTIVLAALIAAVPLLYAVDAQAAGEIRCRMSFNLSGWSAFYKTASGTGDVTCSNGQTMHVHLRSRGGGLTFGKSSITGEGKFSGIFDIKEILGTYANAQAHAGAVKSAHGVVMTKGNVSLAMSGRGRGWDLGIDFGKFTISQ
jgi:hypothetical protein